MVDLVNPGHGQGELQRARRARDHAPCEDRAAACGNVRRSDRRLNGRRRSTFLWPACRHTERGHPSRVRDGLRNRELHADVHSGRSHRAGAERGGHGIDHAEHPACRAPAAVGAFDGQSVRPRRNAAGHDGKQGVQIDPAHVLQLRRPEKGAERLFERDVASAAELLHGAEREPGAAEPDQRGLTEVAAGRIDGGRHRRRRSRRGPRAGQRAGEEGATASQCAPRRRRRPTAAGRPGWVSLAR